jgi:hypothetical protein
MKLYPIFNKLPLIALLSLGLACSPLVVSADDDDRDRHGKYQQNRGKPHHRIHHCRDYHDHQNDRCYDKRGDYSKHRESYPVKSSAIHHGRSCNIQPYRIQGHRHVVVVRPIGQWHL